MKVSVAQKKNTLQWRLWWHKSSKKLKWITEKCSRLSQEPPAPTMTWSPEHESQPSVWALEPSYCVSSWARGRRKPFSVALLVHVCALHLRRHNQNLFPHYPHPPSPLRPPRFVSQEFFNSSAPPPMCRGVSMSARMCSHVKERGVDGFDSPLQRAHCHDNDNAITRTNQVMAIIWFDVFTRTSVMW